MIFLGYDFPQKFFHIKNPLNIIKSSFIPVTTSAFHRTLGCGWRIFLWQALPDRSLPAMSYPVVGCVHNGPFRRHARFHRRIMWIYGGFAYCYGHNPVVVCIGNRFIFFIKWIYEFMTLLKDMGYSWCQDITTTYWIVKLLFRKIRYKFLWIWNEFVSSEGYSRQET